MDIELIKSALTNNSEKTISQNTLKRILVQRIMSSIKINNFLYDISNLLSRLEESQLSEEQKEALRQELLKDLGNKYLVQKKKVILL